MSEASAASQIASVARSAVAQQAHSARESVRPEQVAERLKLSQAKSSQSSTQFDATGQISSLDRSNNVRSSTSNVLDLLT